MINFLTQLLDCLYRKRCYLCGKTKESAKVCSVCLAEIRKNEFNHSFNIDVDNGVQFYYAGFYAKDMQKLIRAIKYHEQREIARYLAGFTFEYWKRFKISEKKFFVVPVPLFPKRQKQRKYNHMELIAKEFCALLDNGSELKPDLIKRIKNTKPQYGLKTQERIDNLKDAFEVDLTNYNGENILLFDDILTTGTTMHEMINTLKTAGVTSITCLAITSHVSRRK